MKTSVKKQSSSTTVPKIDRNLLCNQLNAFKNDLVEEEAKQNYAFGMKSLEKDKEQIGKLAFRDQSDIPIPVTPEVIEKLKLSSEQKSDGVWEIALNSEKLNKEDTDMAKFLDQRIPSIVDSALKQFNLCRTKLHGLEVRPTKLTIMQKGSSLSTSPTNDPGVFATMLVQFPVKHGYLGGLLRVQRGNQTRLFRNSTSSCRLFHYTVFFSDSTLHCEEIKKGSRVVMTFDLVSTNSFPSILSTTAITQVANVLQNLKPKGADRLLAIPLQEEDSSFSCLSSGSSRLVDLFTSIDFLQIQLAHVSCHRIGKARKTGECCRQGTNCTCQQITMGEVSTERISTVKWLDCYDKGIHFNDFNIDPKIEVLGDEPLFPGKPSEEKFNRQAQVVEQWFHRPVLVVWHKEQSFQFDWLYRRQFLLDELEQQVKLTENKEHVRNLLKKIIDFCLSQSQVIAWKADVSSSRLLELCLKVEAYDEAVSFLELSTHEGITSAMMASIVTQLICQIGWKKCSESIEKLISIDRAKEQMHHCVQFVINLLDIENYEAAVAVASKICTNFFNNNLIRVEISVFASFFDAMLRLNEKHPTINLTNSLTNLITHTTKRVTEFRSFTLLVTNIHRRLKARSTDGIADSTNTLFCNLCRHLSKMTIPATVLPVEVLSAIETLVSCGQDDCLQDFVHSLAQNQHQQNILKSLLALDHTWKLVAGTPQSRSAISVLIDKRIEWLLSALEGESPWSYPDEVVVGHPTVEAFLRSSRQHMIYRNFNNMQHARNWARKHFWHSYIAEAIPYGSGRNAYCEITKTVENEEILKRLIPYQNEVLLLIEKRLRILGDTICSYVVDSTVEKHERICSFGVLKNGSQCSCNDHNHYGSLLSGLINSPQSSDKATKKPATTQKVANQKISQPVNAVQKNQPSYPVSASLPPSPVKTCTKVAAKATVIKSSTDQKPSPRSPVKYGLSKPITAPVMPTPRRPGVAKRPLSIVNAVFNNGGTSSSFTAANESSAKRIRTD